MVNLVSSSLRPRNAPVAIRALPVRRGHGYATANSQLERSVIHRAAHRVLRAVSCERIASPVRGGCLQRGVRPEEWAAFCVFALHV